MIDSFFAGLCGGSYAAYSAGAQSDGKSHSLHGSGRGEVESDVMKLKDKKNSSIEIYMYHGWRDL